jgi:pimeloyl-ACP methyl ester carboxylesterase
VKILTLLLLFLGSVSSGATTDNPEPNRMPPRGITVPPEIRTQLETETVALGRDIETSKKLLAKKPELLELLPDVQIFYNAVRYALDDDIFYTTNDFKIAKQLLAQGAERLQQLHAGQAPWNTATGLVVHGYISRIDGSVQPYGLVVPASFQPGATNQHRLDFWFHGRGDKLSELSFIHGRETSVGEFAPADTFVLHPYGRYCNAYKFAGEVDVFEALADVERHYPIDTNRISVRGFSMGGAATWHFAAHHAGLWAAASPGAGFVEVATYTKAFEKNPPPTWYEQKLWHLYNATDYAGNLFNCGVVAYSGEIDPQKQAADLMSNAMSAEGLTLMHIIGPNTAHKYEPVAKKKVTEMVDAIANKGRDPLPHEIKFTTWTLRYNQMDWVTVDGLEKHWERARVNASFDETKGIALETTNVSALTIALPGARSIFPKVSVNGQILKVEAYSRNDTVTAHFKKLGTNWMSLKSLEAKGLQKSHGLQGPIDDAFMDSFIFVRPTGKPMNAQVAAWAADGLTHAIEQWRLQFRGEPRVKNDTDITAADIASNNLILWGDPSSNKLLARMAKKLPIHWDAQSIQLGGTNYPADHFAPVFIYPNPLNPAHYVVLNTGFTFSEMADKSNALQIPKLPDYAVVDIKVPLAKRVPDGVVTAGFFDEHWALPSSESK